MFSRLMTQFNEQAVALAILNETSQAGFPQYGPGLGGFPDYQGGPDRSSTSDDAYDGSESFPSYGSSNTGCLKFSHQRLLLFLLHMKVKDSFLGIEIFL